MTRAEFAAELGITVDRLREEEMSFILSEGFDDIGREYETLGDWIARTPTTDPRDPVDGGRGSGTLGEDWRSAGTETYRGQCWTCGLVGDWTPARQASGVCPHCDREAGFDAIR